MSLETFFSISEECILFLLSTVMGAGLGILYDIFRIIRIIFPFASKKSAVFVEDILFMLISGAAVFLYAAVMCRGQVRFFCILGTFLGFLLYITAVGNAIIGLLRRIAEKMRKIQ